MFTSATNHPEIARCIKAHDADVMCKATHNLCVKLEPLTRTVFGLRPTPESLTNKYNIDVVVANKTCSQLVEADSISRLLPSAVSPSCLYMMIFQVFASDHPARPRSSTWRRKSS